jgi:hypothetical protein
VAKIRNISGEALVVPELNWRTVEPDEVTAVPDERVDAYTCQPSTWAAEASSSKGA